ncbi:MAG: ethanolamine utilization protein EutQ [Gammaproteobacteria bacterium]|nr:ethanolamine utilization protein EutQ [Gammaproteobacteria bacterium]
MATQKAELRVKRFDALEFAPRFEFGDMAQVVDTGGSKDGSEHGTGWGRFSNARIPWTIRYDEVLTVFEGELRVHADDAVHVLKPRDSIWLSKGTTLIHEAQSALVHFAIHLRNWHQG